MLAMSFCDSEFSVVTHPASANKNPSAASRASPNFDPNVTPNAPLVFTQPEEEIE